MTDKEFLTWIYERLQFVYNENPLYDYMHRLEAVIEACPIDRISRVKSLEADSNANHC